MAAPVVDAVAGWAVRSEGWQDKGMRRGAGEAQETYTIAAAVDVGCGVVLRTLISTTSLCDTVNLRFTLFAKSGHNAPCA